MRAGQHREELTESRFGVSDVLRKACTLKRLSGIFVFVVWPVESTDQKADTVSASWGNRAAKPTTAIGSIAMGNKKLERGAALKNYQRLNDVLKAGVLGDTGP